MQGKGWAVIGNKPAMPHKIWIIFVPEKALKDAISTIQLLELVTLSSLKKTDARWFSPSIMPIATI